MQGVQTIKMKLRAFLILSIFLILFCAHPVLAAEYLGADLDGHLFDATAYSYGTGKYYYVQVEFEGDQVYLYFPKGSYIILDLDDEEIDDPHSISAYDYKI